MGNSVSVIIPIASGEAEWEELVSSLALPVGSEIILAGGTTDCGQGNAKHLSPVDLRTVPSGTGRAGSMNAGAKEAQNDWLWFLHADSRMASDTLDKLNDCLASEKDCLFFFDLAFRDDGPVVMCLNEWAVRFRAGVLKIPFGDQGFLIRKGRFFSLGGYREDLPYGEDHVFVWKARQEGVSVRRTGGRLLTSARKYRKGGWVKVTMTHVWLTIRQAAPEFLKLLSSKTGQLRP